MLSGELGSLREQSAKAAASAPRCGQQCVDAFREMLEDERRVRASTDNLQNGRTHWRAVCDRVAEIEARLSSRNASRSPGGRAYSSPRLGLYTEERGREGACEREAKNSLNQFLEEFYTPLEEARCSPSPGLSTSAQTGGFQCTEGPLIPTLPTLLQRAASPLSATSAGRRSPTHASRQAAPSLTPSVAKPAPVEEEPQQGQDAEGQGGRVPEGLRDTLAEVMVAVQKVLGDDGRSHVPAPLQEQPSHASSIGGCGGSSHVPVPRAGVAAGPPKGIVLQQQVSSPQPAPGWRVQRYVGTSLGNVTVPAHSAVRAMPVPASGAVAPAAPGTPLLLRR